MDKYKYLIKNIGFLTISQFATKLLSFFLVPLYTSVLTTAEYGTYDLASTVISLMVPILTLNVSEAIIVFALDKQNAPGDVLSVGLKYTCIGTVLILIASFLGKGIPFFETLAPYWFYIPIMFLTNSMSSVLSNFARGIERVKSTAVAGTISAFVAIVLNIWFLVGLRLGLTGYFLANIIGPVAQILYLAAACKIWKYLKTDKKSAEFEGKMTAYSKPLIANTVAWWVNGSLDKVVVVSVCGIAENGIYAVAGKIPSILNIFQTIFNQAWTISAVKDFDAEDSTGFFSNTYQVYNCMMVVLCSCVIWSDRILSTFLYSKDFFTAWKYVPWLTISIVFGALSGHLGGIFSAVKKSKDFAKSTVVGAGINMLCNVLLTPLIGAMGAAIGTAIGYFCVWALRYSHATKYIRLKINVKRDIFTYILLVLQTVLLLFMKPGVGLYLVQTALLLTIVFAYRKDLLLVLRSVLGKRG